jgi:hypothetical protein
VHKTVASGAHRLTRGEFTPFDYNAWSEEIRKVTSVRFIQPKTTVGARDALRVLLDPPGVFGRIEDTPAYARALVLLLVLTTLLGIATVKTGLIDLEVDRDMERAIATLEREQGEALKRIELSERIQAIMKASVFNKLIMRGAVSLTPPLQLLASVLVIASLLYTVVALAGNKPEYHTLIAICVYASAVDVLGHILRLGMMLAYRTARVDTSLGLLMGGPTQPVGLKSVLTAIDPLRIWFWILVVVGVVTTRQLGRRAAILVCTLFCLVAVAARVVPMMATVKVAE